VGFLGGCTQKKTHRVFFGYAPGCLNPGIHAWMYIHGVHSYLLSYCFVFVDNRSVGNTFIDVIFDVIITHL